MFWGPNACNTRAETWKNEWIVFIIIIDNRFQSNNLLSMWVSAPLCVQTWWWIPLNESDYWTYDSNWAYATVYNEVDEDYCSRKIQLYTLFEWVREYEFKWVRMNLNECEWVVVANLIKHRYGYCCWLRRVIVQGYIVVVVNFDVIVEVCGCCVDLHVVVYPSALFTSWNKTQYVGMISIETFQDL